MNRSLQGLRVLNTRPQNLAHKLSQHLSDAEGIAVELPTLEIKATSTNWIRLLPDLNTIDQAIFISAHAVHYCFTQLNEQNIEWPNSIQVIAIGRGSATALHEYQVPAPMIPELPDSEHLLALNTLQYPKNQNILLFKGEGGRPLIEEQLLHKGANLLVLPVYQRVMPKMSHEFIQSIWRNDLVDIILLTSEQSLHHLLRLFDREAHDWLRNKIWLVISKRLAQFVSAVGIKTILISHPDTIVNTLLDYVNKD